MNNFGIALAVLGLFNYSSYFSRNTTYVFIEEKYLKWRGNHETLNYWLYWSSDTSYLLFHWFFNLRYVKSTFRLPLLKKSAEFFNEMLQRIIEQRED